jgi:hypothetical protein
MAENGKNETGLWPRGPHNEESAPPEFDLSRSEVVDTRDSVGGCSHRPARCRRRA